MAHTFDPELQAAVGRMMAMAAEQGLSLERTPAARGDWRSLRAASEAALAAWEATAAEHGEITRSDFEVVSRDGIAVPLRWYTPPGYDTSTAGPAAVYLHGGGMILANVDLYDRYVAAYVADSGVPLLAVDYRRAPEAQHPAPVEDCYSGLRWLVQHAGELGVQPERVAVMGDSGGGGLAAGVALLARERGLALAKQILVYPMLDDRNTVPDPALVPFAGWSYDDNYTGWSALLGGAIGGPDVPAVAAPARAEDVSGLPATYVEVGELDIFRDESIGYARRIAAAGTSVELHVHPGCPHGFERVSSEADVVKRSRADRVRALRSF
ncbi:MAG: Alpha/beta hydrolase fold-3 domain protein [Sphaerisporangium sp.]|nr:Alpha/beta hydrolase fold-3 domain protein [Sphaerisporangium sp.]